MTRSRTDSARRPGGRKATPGLRLEALEARENPVLGAFDVPFASDTDAPLGSTDVTGIIDLQVTDKNGTSVCSGNLLDVGGGAVGSRYVVTAAHCISDDPDAVYTVTFNVRVPADTTLQDGRFFAAGSIRQIDIPVVGVYVHPDWNGVFTDNKGDIALLTLASAAPAGTAQYRLYSPDDVAVRNEVGQTFFMGGYGLSGTGTIGQATNEELQRLTVNATAGQFRIVVPPNNLGLAAGAQSNPLPYNATPAQVTTELLRLGIGTATAPPLVLRPAAGPFAANSYEILFPTFSINNVPQNFPRLQAVSDPAAPLVVGPNAGSVTVTTMLNAATDPEYQRITVTATGGTFQVGLPDPSNAQSQVSFTDPLPYNVAPAVLQAALEGLPGIGEVTVRLVDSGPAAGSYEIAFDDLTFAAGVTDLPLVTLRTGGLTGGTATANTIIDNGERVLRLGRNTYDRVAGNTLVSDFDRTGFDSFEGQGDSGSGGLVLVENGRLAIASVVSYGGFVFGDPEFNTRASAYSKDILDQATRPGYAAVVDMATQLAGNDQAADAFRVTQTGDQVQVFVRSGATGQERLYYADSTTRVGSVVLRGSQDADTFVIDPSVTGVLVRVEGGGGAGVDTLVTPGRDTVWTVSGTGTGSAVTTVAAGKTADLEFANVANVTAGAGADTFRFLTAGKFAGTVNGGGGDDTLDLSPTTVRSEVRVTGAGPADGFDLSAAVVSVAANGTETRTPYAAGFRNFNAARGGEFVTTDSLTGPDSGGAWTVDGAGGTFRDAGTSRTFGYRFFETLAGGGGADAFSVRTTAGRLAIFGGGGDDSADVGGAQAADGAIGGPLSFTGGQGSDQFRVAGVAGNDTIRAVMTGVGTGTFTGATLPFGVGFAETELATFDGAGGANAVSVEDATGVAWGTPEAPQNGIVYSPTGAASGVVRVGAAGRIGVAGVTAGLTVTGDTDGFDAQDVLAVTGTSGPGARTAFGEHELPDGRDRIDVTDAGVTISNLTAGPLLGLTYGRAGGLPAFGTIYIAGGTERTADGDVMTAAPTTQYNLVLDGQGPTSGTRPGDRASISGGAGGTTRLATDPALGPPQVRYEAADGSLGLIGFESGQQAAAGVGFVAVGTGGGVESRIRVLDRTTGELRFEVTPFPGFTGGVSVAGGDLTGDGLADLVVGAGPGGGPRVLVLNGLDGSLVYDFFGYEPIFRGGVNVSTGDFDDDGQADIVLGTGVGGGPRVRILSGRDLRPIRDVFAYDAAFRGGVNVATGDVNADGTPDLVTSTGVGGGPRVVVLDGRTLRSIASFFVFDPSSRAGFTASAADVNGDGFADVIAGAGTGDLARVRVFSGLNRAVLSDFYLNDPFNPGEVGNANTAGVRVATADVNGDGIPDVLTTQGPGTPPVVRTFQLAGVNPTTNALFTTLQEIRRQTVFDDGLTSGVFIGASD